MSEPSFIPLELDLQWDSDLIPEDYVYDPFWHEVPPIKFRVTYPFLGLDVFLDDHHLLGDLLEHWFPMKTRSSNVDRVLDYLSSTNPVQLCYQDVDMELGLTIMPAKEEFQKLCNLRNKAGYQRWRDHFEMPDWEKSDPPIWDWDIVNKEPEDDAEEIILAGIPELNYWQVHGILMLTGRDPSFDNVCMFMKNLHKDVLDEYLRVLPQFLELTDKETVRKFEEDTHAYLKAFMRVIAKSAKEGVLITDEYLEELERRSLPESLEGKIHEGYDEYGGQAPISDNPFINEGVDLIDQGYGAFFGFNGR